MNKKNSDDDIRLLGDRCVNARLIDGKSAKVTENMVLQYFSNL